MKVRITLEIADRKVDEELTGTDAADILAQAKERVEQELGWKGLFIKIMTPLGFAQEVVRRYNAHSNSNFAIPQTADEFLSLGADLGYLKPSTE